MGHSVGPEIVRYSQRWKGHNRFKGTGKSFIIVSGILPTSTSVDGGSYFCCHITDGVIVGRWILLRVSS